MLRNLRSLLLLVTCGAITYADELRWPAFGLIDTDEGTFECWIKFGFDPQEFRDAKQAKGQGSLFAFNPGDPLYPGEGWSIQIGAGWAGPAYTRNGIARHGVDCGLYTGFGADARRGEWYHFAMAWRDGRKFQIYINGKLVGESTCRTRFDQPTMPNAHFSLLGGTIAVDDVRLSRIARKPEELGCGAAGTVKDTATVWLLTFDQGDNASRSIASDHSATAAAAITLPLPASFGIVPGKNRQALALCNPSLFQ